MNQKSHPVHPDISEEMWGKVDKIIANGKGKPGSVISVLRESQEVVGYLPTELISHISRGLVLPTSEVFGVATFYSFFSLTPKGRHTVRVCTGTACYVKGIKEAIGRISNTYGIKEGETTEDRKFSLEGVRCLGACGLAPVMIVDKDIYGEVTSDKVINILEKYE